MTNETEEKLSELNTDIKEESYKDRIEHAKIIYEKSKEIYKYTYENMKFLDSKLTRSINLITFIFTVQTGFVTLILSKMPEDFFKGILVMLSILTYILLISGLIIANRLSEPKIRESLALSPKINNEDINNYTTDYSGTFKVYTDLCHDISVVENSLDARNKTIAQSLVLIHKITQAAYVLVAFAALIIMIFPIEKPNHDKTIYPSKTNTSAYTTRNS